MRRFFYPALRPLVLAVMILGLAPSLSRGQDGIRVSGKYTLVIQETPFTLTAPAGTLHFWRVPDGWTVTSQKERLTVTKANEGAATVLVTVVTINFKEEKVEEQTYALSLVVGRMPDPGPGPPPVPSPDNPFTDSWAKETRADRVEVAGVIADLYAGHAAMVKASANITGQQLFDHMSAKYKMAGVQGKLVHLVTDINQWLADNLKTPQGAMNENQRAAAEQAFLKVSKWVKELK